MFNNRKKYISAAVLAVTSSIYASQGLATMPSNAILNFDDGVFSCQAGGTYPTCQYGVTTVATGSYFTMDTNSNSTFDETERVAITNAGSGLNLAASQSVGELDNQWIFGNNPGYHHTSTANGIPQVVSDDNGGNVTIDMNGWTVYWGASGGEVNIDMGTGSPAIVTCGNTCENGDTFSLSYDTIVPAGQPFAGVPYELHLEGTISVPVALTTDAGGLSIGTYATSASSSDGRITMQQLVDQGVPADTNYTYNGGLYDFILTGAGATSRVLITLTAPIPQNAVYRKYIDGAWQNFTVDANNILASAAKVSGNCPAIGDAAYSHTNGLVEGDECLQITLEDDGPNDSDKFAVTSNANTIADPSGVALETIVVASDRSAGTNGCSMSASPANSRGNGDWLVVFGFIALLGLVRKLGKSA